MSSHWTRKLLAAGAALAATLAVPAAAQYGKPGPATRPAPTPAPTTQAPPAAQAPQAQAADPAMAAANQRLQQVHDTAGNVVAVAKIAQQKAQSQQAKDLANKVVSDWQPIIDQVNGLGRERGMTFAAPSAEAQRDLQGTTAQLNSLSGGEFDRAFLRAEAQGFETVEQQLKDLREATPGNDARLKKWLDDTENVAEKSVADSRDARTQLREVQGRSGK